jgi:hypothetical protein
MKHLKIYLAILLFSFLGSMHNQLLAQEPRENIGYWGRSINQDQYLENGDYRAKLRDNGLVIYNKNGNSGERFIKINPNKVERLHFQSGLEAGSDIILKSWSNEGSFNLANLAVFRRSESGPAVKVLDSSTPVISSCYFQLETDGRFVIYHGTVGIFNSAGTPIIELVEN